MLHPDPTKRPSCEEILAHPAICTQRHMPQSKKSKQQLVRELNAERKLAETLMQ